jgi:Ca-activated chloride channel homolog
MNRLSPMKPIRTRRGAVIPMFALMLPIIIILAAIAINISYIELNRTEMYIASDAATRAAGREFMVTGDMAMARAKGRDAASRNAIGGKPLQLADDDFVFGEANRSNVSTRYDFTPGGGKPNAVEVTAKRTSGSLDGPLKMLLPNLVSTANVDSIQTARSNQIEVDIALVLDRSGSMAYASNEAAVYPPLPVAAPAGWFFNGPAPTPSRWRDAVSAIEVFLNELQLSAVQEKVSLCTYNGDAFIDQEMTLDYDSLRVALDFYTNYFQMGSTNIGGGINAGHTTFESSNSRSYAARVMIVLTDGIDTAGSDPVGAASQAADQGIMIFTITFANEADQATMQNVAKAGRGNHYHASDSTDLNLIFQDIAKRLPLLLSR